MSKIDETYHDLVTNLMDKGFWYDDPKRKGTKRLQIPRYIIEHDLTKSFPAITTKKLAWESVVGELIWFLRGDSNIKYLVDNNINIWNKDAYAYYVRERKKAYDRPPVPMEDFIARIKARTTEGAFGSLGPIYGSQWRGFDGVDQIRNLIEGMIMTPMSTEHIVTAWNPGEKDMQALPPCHFMFQIMMQPLTDDQKKKYGMEYGFTLEWSQRSVDTFLGLPFNIASYGLLAHIIGRLTRSVPLQLVGDLRNVHLYDNSIKGVEKQLSRYVNEYEDCQLAMGMKGWEYSNDLNEIIDNLKINDFQLPDYGSYPGIKVEMLERND